MLVPLVPVIGEPSAPSNSLPVRANELSPALVRGLCLSLKILVTLSTSPHRHNGRHPARHRHPGVAVLAAVLPAEEDAAHRLVAPPAAALGAVRLPGAHHVGHALPLEDHPHAHPHDGGLALVYHVAAVDVVPAVAHAPVVHAPLGVLAYAVADALAVEGALVLGQHLEHAQLQDARRAGGYVLACVQHLDARAPEHDARHGHLVAVAHDARHLVDDHVVEQAAPRVGHHALELGAVGGRARLRVVAVLGDQQQAVLRAVGARRVELDLYGLAPLAVRRVARVYGRPASLGHIMLPPSVHAVGILTASRRVTARMRGAFVCLAPPHLPLPPNPRNCQVGCVHPLQAHARHDSEVCDQADGDGDKHPVEHRGNRASDVAKN